MSTQTIKVDVLARVEGEGGLFIKIRDDKVQDVKLSIFEPPRMFEGILRGRSYAEAPDITARICGICPIAYQMSSVHAMERAFGVTVGGQLRELRRLIYCGEWIESHVLHVYMLHAPDFLGYPDAITLAKDYPDVVKTALRLKKIGNHLMSVVGGREIHPINVRVGGFYRVPTKRELQALVPDLEWAREAAVEMVRFTAGLSFPELEKDYEFVALRHPDEYPFNEGRLVSNKGLDIDIEDYNVHFVEQHVAHSTALHSVVRERGAYFVGPMARFNLDFDKLPESVQELAQEIGVLPPVVNPFQSIVVRSLETLYAVEEALRIIEQYEMPEQASVVVTPRAAVGHGCSEAPRGILYHRYSVDDDGNILTAQIVPPTSQNQKTIEDDLWQFVEKQFDLPQDELVIRCEQAVRNYDPCISCSVHFLKLDIDRA
ncbi:MAG: Ni/Fe hydrogenase subunit alpha [Anaerolineae bacterium]|nr:Ni/Fe hydrogenase subunit alpha [Anaerolineae bacterium]